MTTSGVLDLVYTDLFAQTDFSIDINEQIQFMSRVLKYGQELADKSLNFIV